MKFSRIALYSLTAGLFSLALAACNFSLAADVTPPPNYRPPLEETQPAPVSGPVYPVLPPNAADGASIFAEKCAPCHGSAGLGDGPQAAQLPNPVPAIGSIEVARTVKPSDWYQVVTQGKIDTFMPPFRSLSDRQRWDVVAYTFSLSASESALEDGKALYQENCAVCHGENGLGDGPDAPAGMPDFNNPQFMADHTSEDFFQVITDGVPQDMPAYEDTLTEQQRWVLSDYVRALSFSAVPSGEMAAGRESSQEGAAPGTGPGMVEAPADPQEGEGTTGVVRGTVLNASGGDVRDGLVVTLHSFDAMQAATTLTTTLQADGSYLFDGVEMPAGNMFLSTIEFEGATYGSELTPATDSRELELPITVYETTTDAANVSIDRLHVFLEFVDADTLRVIELYILSNTGEETLVAAGEGQPTISFNLPEGAANLEIQNGVLGERFIETPGGFGDSVALRPGAATYQLMFAFEMPYNRSLDLVQPVSLPTNAVVILVPDGSIAVKGESIQDTGQREVDGMTYRMYNSSSLAAGENLRLTISGRYEGEGAALINIGSDTDLLFGVGAFGLVLIVAGILLYRRSSTDSQEEPEAGVPMQAEVSPAEDPDTLMDAILTLDDLYREGKLPEEAYRQRRSELKERLRKSMEAE